MKALVLEHPEDPSTHELDDQFYAGPSLLVAPVVADGVRSRDVYLPGGDWYDFWTGERVGGGGTVRADAPFERIPIFARAGHVVPMHPPAPHSGVPAPEALILRLYPGAGRSSAYFDDGISYAFEHGDSLVLSFGVSETPAGVEVRIDREGRRHLPYHAFDWRLDRSHAGSVAADGRDLSRFETVSEWAASDEGVVVDDGRLRIRTRTDVGHLRIDLA
jgi:alpha-glucosidase (family GH31 glycosyl hydrolase)